MCTFVEITGQWPSEIAELWLAKCLEKYETSFRKYSNVLFDETVSWNSKNLLKHVSRTYTRWNFCLQIIMFFAFSQNSVFSNRAWYSLQVRLENHLKVEEMTSKFILPIHFKILWLCLLKKMKLSDKQLNCMKMCQKAPKCADFSINPGEACPRPPYPRLAPTELAFMHSVNQNTHIYSRTRCYDPEYRLELFSVCESVPSS